MLAKNSISHMLTKLHTHTHTHVRTHTNVRTHKHTHTHIYIYIIYLRLGNVILYLTMYPNHPIHYSLKLCKFKKNIQDNSLQNNESSN